MKKLAGLMVATAALVGGAALGAKALFGGAPAYYGTLLDPPLPARDFELESVDGPFRLSDLRGQHVAVFFGYTWSRSIPSVTRPSVWPSTHGPSVTTCMA
jgi:cytochrome oxidase Cu insertion factor (SCO1/SenC/PrrC family)